MIPKQRIERARQLRSESTLFEQSFWQQVRAGRLSGFKFRRQQPIGPYIVDFVCQQARLIVELDGSQHLDTREYDENRDAWLRSQGYRVLRVWNSEWNANPAEVLETVWAMLQVRPSPQPLPPNGGGAFTQPRTPSPQPLPPNGGGAFTPLSHLGRGVGGEGDSSEEVEA